MIPSLRHLPPARARRWLILVLGLYLLLALAYGIVNPLFEAPDEHWHYFTAQYIADTGSLPQVTANPDPWLAQEAAQPPLYYLLAGSLIRPLDTGGAREVVWANPFVHLGDASVPVNRNAFVHGPWEAWPWQGYALAVHLLRGMSALFGLGTLLAIYGAGRLLWPARPQRALLAIALSAFLPQFLFVHSAVSNDPLIILLVAVALWQLLFLWLHGGSSGRFLLLGLTIGLAILSKTAGLLLLVYATGVLMLRGWQQRSLSNFLKPLLLVVVPALLLSGWLLWRNWTLYGDITAVNQFIRIAGGDRAYSLVEVLAESSGLWTSFVAVFGWFNVRAPAWLYWIWNGVVLSALLGWLANFISSVGKRARPNIRLASRRSIASLLLAAWPLLVYAGLVNFMLRTPAAQGRLLFPALLPLALAVAAGLDHLRGRLPVAVAPFLALGTAVYSLLFVIPPVYAVPEPVTETAIPPAARAYQAPLAQGIRLAGAELEARSVQPGDVLWLTLYWEADAVPAEPPEVVLELFGYEQMLVGKLHSYHGGGLYPPQLWPEEGIIADRVGVRLDEKMNVPTVVNLQLGLAGAPRRVPVGAVKAVPERWPSAADTVRAQLGEGIRLMEATADRSRVRPGERLNVSVEWQVIAPPGDSLTTFLHLGPPGEPPLATGDSVPRQGNYPTNWWERGEVILDNYALTLPAELAPGRYPLFLGMYHPENGMRVRLTVGGERQANDAYPVAWITVE